MRKLVAVPIFAVFVLFGSIASAGSGEIRTQGGESFVPNAKIMSNLKFTPGHTASPSGGSLTWRHADRTPEPHTITIVDEGDLPGSIEEVFGCEACSDALDAHFAGGFNPVVNVGAPGLDQPGDSMVLFAGESVSAEVSAPGGTTLSYLCAIHPWMQGSIRVG